MRRYAWMFLVAAGLMVAAADDPAKDDKDKIQGTWQTVSIAVDGKEEPAEAATSSKTIFQADNYTQTVKERAIEKGMFALDPSKSPKAIDFAIKKGADRGKNQVGIYLLDGDDLKICVAPAGASTRPAEFASKPGTGSALVVLKRAKP